MRKLYIQRQIFDQLIQNLNHRSIGILLGPRQVGKTTLLQKLQEYLITQKKITKNQIIFLNFDDISLQQRFKEQPTLFLKEIEKYLAVPLEKLKTQAYLFIDEVQKIPEIFDSIKLIFDQHQKRIKIFLSGSSSLLIHKRVGETFAGRTRLFYLYPFTIHEIINHYVCPLKKSLILSLLSSKNLFTKEKLLTIQATIYRKRHLFSPYWDHLLVYGALPKILSEPTPEDKWRTLGDFLTIYIEREIRSLKEIGDINLFTKVLRSFFLRDSQILNLSRLSSDFGIHRETLRKYLSILKETLILNLIEPYYGTETQRLVKSPKIIFFDHGPINYQGGLRSVNQLETLGVAGKIFENLIINNLLRFVANLPLPPQLFFWQDYQGHEIDLVVKQADQLIPIEIIYSNKIPKEKLRNFNIFFHHYKEAIFGIIIYTGDLEITTLDKKQLFLIPYWLWW